MSALPLRLVVLAFNEAANLEPLLSRVDAALSPRAWHAFIVDDGSTDDTPAVLARLGARLPVTGLSHGENRGIAAAFLTGLRAALAGASDDDAVAVLEGDGTSDPALLPAMLKSLEEPCDVVVASRHVPGGGYRRFPAKRLFLSLAANAVLRLLCGLAGVRDYSIFYRLYRAGPLKRALTAHGDRFTSVGGFASNAEMLLRLRPFVRAVREVPFVYDYGLKNGPSSMRPAREFAPYLRLFEVWRAVSRPPPN